MVGPVDVSLRERVAERLVGGATTFGLDCLEMRANAEHRGLRLSAIDPMFQVIVLHEWLSGALLRAAQEITPRSR